MSTPTGAPTAAIGWYPDPFDPRGDTGRGVLEFGVPVREFGGLRSARMVWALVSGLILLLAFVVLALPDAIAAAAPNASYDKPMIETAIRDASISRGIPLASVECPVAPPFHRGSTFDCFGRNDLGLTVTFRVTVNDDSGSILFEAMH